MAESELIVQDEIKALSDIRGDRQERRERIIRHFLKDAINADGSG